MQAHIERLATFAQHGQPKDYAASDMMRADLEALIMQPIAQPEQTAFNIKEFTDRVFRMVDSVKFELEQNKLDAAISARLDVEHFLLKHIAQPEQTAPVAWMTIGYMGEPIIQRHPPQYANQVTPLYTHPAPTRLPLTIQEVEQILAQHNYELHGDRARYIVSMTEAAHGIAQPKAQT